VDIEIAAMPLTERTLTAASGEDSLARAQRGELAGFDQLMRAHEARVFSIVQRGLGKASAWTEYVVASLKDAGRSPQVPN
jgi:hypothetical protein